MVRGNWQRRVEIAQQRRADKKEAKANKKEWAEKAPASVLARLLRRRPNACVWLTALPPPAQEGEAGWSSPFFPSLNSLSSFPSFFFKGLSQVLVVVPVSWTS